MVMTVVAKRMPTSRRLLFALLATVLSLLLIEGILRIASPVGGLLQGQPEETMVGSEAIMAKACDAPIGSCPRSSVLRDNRSCFSMRCTRAVRATS